MVLKLEHVSKVFPAVGAKKSGESGSGEISVLKDINLALEAADICSLVGPSGSGKTSLLGICAGLEPASSGSVELVGEDLEQLSEEQRCALRNARIGFVFQSFQLIPSLTALENVMLPAELGANSGAREAAYTLLERVGLEERVSHYPTQLSGGEQQRVALARAFINKPSILFADEPTGNLDEQTASRVERLLFELHEEFGTTLVLATHNMQLARKTKRLLRLSQGMLQEEVVN